VCLPGTASATAAHACMRAAPAALRRVDHPAMPRKDYSVFANPRIGQASGRATHGHDLGAALGVGDGEEEGGVAVAAQVHQVCQAGGERCGRDRWVVVAAAVVVLLRLALGGAGGRWGHWQVERPGGPIGEAVGLGEAGVEEKAALVVADQQVGHAIPGRQSARPRRVKMARSSRMSRKAAAQTSRADGSSKPFSQERRFRSVIILT